MVEKGTDNSLCGKKIVPLEEAVSRGIRPGMAIHLNTGAYASALVREVIRQYLGKDAGFTVVSSGVTTPYEIGLACSGLVKHVITTNHSYTYPTPRPIPMLQEMHKKGLIGIEDWSLYSLEQRLMAGALGMGFLPTKSLVGTSLGEDNAHAFTMMDDPFGSGQKVGAVKALVPDISLIHGCVADPEGNLILSPPYFTSIWGARASKEGAIATVEKIVSREFIKKHSALVKVPGNLVKFLCPVPFGAHPQGLAAESIGVCEGYREDYGFIKSFVERSQDTQDFKEWLEEWAVRCRDQEEYLRKLGQERVESLKWKGSRQVSDRPETGHNGKAAAAKECNETQRMILAAAKKIKAIVETKNYNAVLAGIGSPGLAAWLAYYLLREEDKEVLLLTGLGQVGFSPRPGDPFLMSLENVMDCTFLTDTVEVYGTLVGGAHNRCLSIIGTAQVDQYGNLNTVKIDKTPLIGVGGAGDAINACESLVVTRQSKKRFMKRVPYVGCSGQRIRTLVTDLGVFEKLDDKGVFTLTQVVGDSSSGRTMEDRIARIRRECGWDLSISGNVTEIPPPTMKELSLLNRLDPEGLFLKR
ncbi:MAG: hypothetical protein JRJ31_06490 [Deltaproteobacteria bacterium]|nr:hypothetical protein [Deltaproteobacteria bacterium]